MIKLTSLINENFGQIAKGVPILTVGEYEVKAYYVLDNDKFVKTLYFDTTIGFYMTTSTTLVSSIFAGFGKLLQDQFDKGETVLVEIVSKRATHNGKFGLAFRTV